MSRTKLDIAISIAASALLRLALMPFNESFYGDAVVRTELAQAWLRSPHWIAAASQGTAQFGPLHIYATAAALALGLSPADAARWLSLVCGTATVVPLFLLTRRLFGRQAGITAAALFSVWGFHLQLSTTGASEALGLLCAAIACASLAAALDTPGRAGIGAWVTSAGFVTLACAVRYDLWLLIPIMGGVVLWRRGVDAALGWGGLAGLFPGLWLLGNAWVDGDAFAPMRAVDAFHRTWASEEQARYAAFWGPAAEVVYPMVQALFWPGMALLTLGPWVATAMGVGLVRQGRSARWLVAVVVLPAVAFTLRAVFLRDFVPLGRFAVVQLALALPFAGSALQSQRSRWVAVTSAATLALATGAFTLRSSSKGAAVVRPVSPVSRNPGGVSRAAQYLRNELPPASTVLLDADPAYWDLQISFLSELPSSRLGRLRSRIEAGAPLPRDPDVLVTLPSGRLLEQFARREGEGVRLSNHLYRRERDLPDGIAVYRR